MKSIKLKASLSLAAVTAVALLAADVNAGAIRTGFDGNTLTRNDDGSTGQVAIGFSDDIDFFGTFYSSLYVNNNGNVTFDNALSTFTPFDLTSTSTKIIAPFFADIDTRSAGDAVTYGAGMVGSRDAFGVNWVNVDYFASSASHTNRNSAQLIMIERFDTGVGNFDFEFNFDQIQWETGTASGGSGDGLGGNSARVGYSNGLTGAAENSLELPGSAINGALLDSGPNALIEDSLNSNVLGRYLFGVRNGTVIVDPSQPAVPAPPVLLLILSGLLAAGAVAKRRNA